MKRDLALKLVNEIIKSTTITEVRLTEAAEQLHEDDPNTEYDILIEETNIFHYQIQALDELLAGYDNIEMLIELSEEQIRIYEKEEEAV